MSVNKQSTSYDDDVAVFADGGTPNNTDSSPSNGQAIKDEMSQTRVL
jgi:hypothetical protein